MAMMQTPTNSEAAEKRLLFMIRAVAAFYILALLFWGLTAFPLESEIRLICSSLGIEDVLAPENYSGLKYWLASVQAGLAQTNLDYPFLAYGTDWLAYSHIVLAVVFCGVYAKPVTNIWIVHACMIACAGVVLVALLCAPIRGVPFFWALVDCAFGVLGIVPLVFLHVWIRRLAKTAGIAEAKY